MKLFSILFIGLIFPFTVFAGAEPGFDFKEDLPHPVTDVKASKSKPKTYSDCGLDYCEKPSADELSRLEGLIKIEEQRRKYLDVKAKRKEAEAAMKTTDSGLALNGKNTIHGLYVSRIASHGDKKVAKIFYQDRFVFKGVGEKLSRHIAVHRINATSVVFNIGGDIQELGLTPQEYIDEEHQFAVSGRQNDSEGGNNSLFAIPIDGSTTTP